MKTSNQEKLKYPIGNFNHKEKSTPKEINSWLTDLEKLPVQLKKLVTNLNELELKFKHRQNGWTIRQLVHHIADSHMNGFVRFKWTITEDEPTIKPYKEDLWAKTPDDKEAHIEFSLKILEGLHGRWSFLIKSNKSNLKKKMFHPEYGNRPVDLIRMLHLYAWHGKHHMGHIKQALNFRNDFRRK